MKMETPSAPIPSYRKWEPTQGMLKKRRAWRGSELGEVRVKIQFLPVVEREEETDDNVQYKW